MKIKFNSDDELPPNKRIEIPSMIIVVRADFHENNKYCPQVFLSSFVQIIDENKEAKSNNKETKITLITNALLIAVSFYCYPIKYKAK